MYSIPTSRLNDVMRIVTKVVKPSRHFHATNFSALEFGQGRSASAVVTAAEGLGFGTVILNFYYLLDLCQSYANTDAEQIAGAFELDNEGDCVSVVTFKPRGTHIPEYLLMPIRA